MTSPFHDDWSDLGLSSSGLGSHDAPPSLPPGGSAGGSVVVLGESRGVAKRSQLLLSDELVGQCVCLGYIGTGNKRFCIKTTSSAGSTCSTASHTIKFQVVPKTFYLRCSAQSAFCHPAFPVALVPTDQLQSIKSARRTIEEWTTLFNDFEATVAREGYDEIGDDPQRSVVVQLDFDPTVGLKTPARPGKTSQTRLWADATPSFRAPVLPSVQGDDDPGYDDTLAELSAKWKEADLPEDLVDLIVRFQEAFEVLAERWPGPFRDVEAHFMLVESDLTLIQQVLQQQRRAMGKQVPLLGLEFPDIWCALEFLATSLRDVQDGLSDNQRDIQELINTRNSMESRMTMVEACTSPPEEITRAIDKLDALVATHERRFAVIRPILQQFRSIPEGATNVDFDAMNRRISQLEATRPSPVDAIAASPHLKDLDARIGALERERTRQHTADDSHWFGSVPQVASPPLDAGSYGALRDIVGTLEAKVVQLERRVVGDGVAVGAFVFQSFDDLRLWMKANVPGNRFGLFMDGVSIFDFFAYAHVDPSDTLTTMYNSQKNEFPTTYEARVAASMQNLFPTLLGKGAADGMDTSRFLPGVPTPDKWEMGGVSGLKHQIDRQIVNVDHQLTHSIGTAFVDYSQAAGLAMECLYKSKRFVIDLSNFMTNDLAFWRGKGYQKLDAWALTCHSVRRVFEDIHAVRVSARDVRDLEDPQSTAAQYLWATLRAHQVMGEYLRRNFYEHPSVSSVIARHLAANHTRPDDNITGRLSGLEKALTTLTSKFDALESRVNAKLANAANAKANPKRNKNKDKDKDPEE